MSFLDFLAGAVKILVAGAVFLGAMFVGSTLMAGGQVILGVIALVLGFVSGIYVVYERRQQSKRV